MIVFLPLTRARVTPYRANTFYIRQEVIKKPGDNHSQKETFVSMKHHKINEGSHKIALVIDQVSWRIPSLIDAKLSIHPNP